MKHSVLYIIYRALFSVLRQRAKREEEAFTETLNFESVSRPGVEARAAAETMRVRWVRAAVEARCSRGKVIMVSFECVGMARRRGTGRRGNSTFAGGSANSFSAPLRRLQGAGRRHINGPKRNAGPMYL
jgi:hypothetical protein